MFSRLTFRSLTQQSFSAFQRRTFAECFGLAISRRSALGGIVRIDQFDFNRYIDEQKSQNGIVA
jgi:hypothetical protein